MSGVVCRDCRGGLAVRSDAAAGVTACSGPNHADVSARADPATDVACSPPAADVTARTSPTVDTDPCSNSAADAAALPPPASDVSTRSNAADNVAAHTDSVGHDVSARSDAATVVAARPDPVTGVAVCAPPSAVGDTRSSPAADVASCSKPASGIDASSNPTTSNAARSNPVTTVCPNPAVTVAPALAACLDSIGSQAKDCATAKWSFCCFSFRRDRSVLRIPDGSLLSKVLRVGACFVISGSSDGCDMNPDCCPGLSGRE